MHFNPARFSLCGDQMLEFNDMLTSFLSEKGAKANALRYKGKTSLKAGAINTAATMLIAYLITAIVAFAMGGGIMQLVLFPLSALVGLVFWFLGDSLAFYVGRGFGGNGDYAHFMGALSYPEGAGRMLAALLGVIPLIGGILYIIAALWWLNMSAKTIEAVHNIGPWKAAATIIISALAMLAGMFVMGLLFAGLGFVAAPTGV